MKPAAAIGRASPIIAAGLALAACSTPEREEREPAPPRVQIVAPNDGAAIEGGEFEVVMAVSGITLRPAGTNTANSGHLHLFVDTPPTQFGEFIGNTDGIIHLGRGQTTHTLTGLPAGEHTIIAMLGNFEHRAIAGSVTDTVRVEIF